MERAIDHIAVVTPCPRVTGTGAHPGMDETRPDVRCRGVTLETRTSAPAEPGRRDTRSADCGLSYRARASRARALVKSRATRETARRSEPDCAAGIGRFT